MTTYTASKLTKELRGHKIGLDAIAEFWNSQEMAGLPIAIGAAMPDRGSAEEVEGLVRKHLTELMDASLAALNAATALLGDIDEAARTIRRARANAGFDI